MEAGSEFSEIRAQNAVQVQLHFTAAILPAMHQQRELTHRSGNYIGINIMPQFFSLMKLQTTDGDGRENGTCRWRSAYIQLP